MITIKTYFLLFLIYSLCGYVLECVYSSILLKKFNFERGFFYGTYCPIYGITILFINEVMKLNSNIYFIVIASFLLIAIIEYSTSFILEKIFKRTWWNYSRKKLNIKGRICLENLIIFSLGGVIINKYITPILNEYFSLGGVVLDYFSFLLFIVFIVDVVFSIRNHYLRKNIKNVL